MFSLVGDDEEAVSPTHDFLSLKITEYFTKKLKRNEITFRFFQNDDEFCKNDKLMLNVEIIDISIVMYDV